MQNYFPPKFYFGDLLEGSKEVIGSMQWLERFSWACHCTISVVGWDVFYRERNYPFFP